MEDFIKFKINIKVEDGKKVFGKFPNGWQNLKKSRYNNEPNFAVLTGSTNGITVIDLDAKDPEFRALKWFVDNFGPIEEQNTLISKSIRGGYHVYFKYTPLIKGKNIEEMNIDIKTDGGCAFEGLGYMIINTAQPRTLSESEIKIIQSLYHTEVRKKKDLLELKQVSKMFDMNPATKWLIESKENGGRKLTPDDYKCLITKDKKHSDTGHSCIYLNVDGTANKVCFSCGSINVQKNELKVLMKCLKIVLSTEENSVFQTLTEDLLEITKSGKYKRDKQGIVYKQVKPYAYTRYKEPLDFLNEIFLDDKTFMSHVNNMDNMVKFMKQTNSSDFLFIEYEYTTDTPLMDSILDYQFNPETRDFIYACLGRLFGIRDTLGFMLYLLGEPGCGKSLIIDIICECFDDVGAIGSTFEEKFGLSFLYNKDIVVCDDLPKNISKLFPQQTFQTIITCGKVPISVKGGDGFTIDWTVPLLWAGNWFPDYIDKGQISRRMLVANFEKHVSRPDPTLKQRIVSTELPAIIYKSLLAYKKLLDNIGKKDIWGVCPEYFSDQQQDQKMETNPLFRFLLERTVYKAGNRMLMSDIKDGFSAYIGKPIRKMDNGTFAQANSEYIVETVKICKHCTKKAEKGCCESYCHKDRLCKVTVLNIELMNEY